MFSFSGYVVIVNASMNFGLLRKSIITLANLPPSEEPIISAYFDLRVRPVEVLAEVEGWMAATRLAFSGQARSAFDAAANRIRVWLQENKGKGKGAAVFCRQSQHPFFRAETFEVPGIGAQ